MTFIPQTVFKSLFPDSCMLNKWPLYLY